MIKRTLYFGNPAYLSFKDHQLKVNKPEEEQAIASIPIEDIGVLVLDNYQLTLTHKLIQALQDNQCAIISCDSHHLPSSLMLPLSGHHTMTERLRTQINISLPLKKQLWKQTMEAKMKNQAALLKKLGKKDDKIQWLIRNIEPGDPKNTEGRAAAYYWKTLLGDDFIREREGELPNAHLNYAYAILRSIIARALVSSGMHPSFGIFHSNKYNAYCLADDIMEPYRIYADALIVQLLQDGEIKNETLNPQAKAAILKLIATDVIIDGKLSPLMVAASRTTSTLYDCMNGERRKIVYPVYQ